MTTLNSQRVSRPDLIDVTTAAKILNVSKRTVVRLCGQNKLPAIKIGMQWRINRKKLLEQVGLAD